MADEDEEEEVEQTKPKLPPPAPIDNDPQWWLKFMPKPNLWSDVNIFRFLRIYKAYPILWDPTHSKYKNPELRCKAYDAIVKQLNLHGIRKKECIDLVESLREMYAEERKRQANAKKCSLKYKPPPSWFYILDDMVASVIQRKIEQKQRADEPTKEMIPMMPWEMCCSSPYTEDIWTPAQFRTDVTDWFLVSQNEEVFCKCYPIPETEVPCNTESTDTETDSEDSICSTATSGSIHESAVCRFTLSCASCCIDSCDTCNIPEQCGVDTNANRRLPCGSLKPKRKKKIPSVCGIDSPKALKLPVGHCGIGSSDDLCEAKQLELARLAEIECKLKKVAEYPSEKKKVPEVKIRPCGLEPMRDKDEGTDYQHVYEEVRCCNDRSETIIEVPCGRKNRRRKKKKFREVLCDGSNEMVVLCEDGVTRVIMCGEEYNSKENAEGLDAIREVLCGMEEEKSCPYYSEMEPELKNIPCGEEENVTPCTSSMSSSSGSTNTSSSWTDKSSMYRLIRKYGSFAELELFSDMEPSDHRLEDPDPTFCEKCAADRVTIPVVHNNIVYYQDPRMSELNDYCYYKDWDEVYNIKTNVPAEKQIREQADCLALQHLREPPRPRRRNHAPTEADEDVFTHMDASNARRVSMDNEYIRQDDKNIHIEQPRHYTCVNYIQPGPRPAQLML